MSFILNQELLTEAKGGASDVINYFCKKLSDYDAKKRRREGTVTHLRLSVPEDIEGIFKKLGAKLEKKNTKAATGSTKFTTYQATLTQNLGDFKKGETFYVVNTFSPSATIRKKMLTPDRLGIAGKPIEVKNFQNVVADSLSKMLEGELLRNCMQLLELQPEEFEHNVSEHNSINDSDLQQIAIDYGEVFGAFWYAKKNLSKFIEFPAKGNNPLVDFYLHQKDKKKISVSSKVDEGGPPSMNAIVAIIEQNKKHFEQTYDNEKLMVIRNIFEYGVVEGILEVHKVLDTPAYKAAKIAGIKDWSKEGIEAWLRKCKTDTEILAALEPIYSAMKPKRRYVKKMTIDIMLETDMKRYGLLTSPLGYNLADILNADKDFSAILNDAATRINADQLYTSLTRNNVTFKVKKHFDAATFEWHFNSNAKQPSLKRLSFKMK